MSNWRDFAVVFYALALAILGNALLWAVAAAFVRLVERHTRRLPPATQSRPLQRTATVSGMEPLARGASR